MTHTATDHLDKCCKAMEANLPSYLKVPDADVIVPDSTSDQISSSSSSSSYKSSSSPEPDLECKEVLSNDSTLMFDNNDDNMCLVSQSEPDFCVANQSKSSKEDAYGLTVTSSSSRSSSPLSAVDIFTEFNTNVLRAVFEQAEGNLDPNYSILVS